MHEGAPLNGSRNTGPQLCLKAKDMSRLQTTFGIVLIVQIVHSIEEYIGHLWESFPPAAFLTGLVASNGETGFVIINVVLVTFGIWCFQWPVRREWSSAAPLIWSWVAIETINGVGHLVWTFLQGGYTPGVATAPVLLGLSVYLGLQLRGKQLPGSAGH